MPAVPETLMPENLEPNESVAVPVTPINNDAYQDDDEATEEHSNFEAQ